LTSIQIKTLQKWNYDSRYSYNKAISILNEEIYDKLTLRNIIVPKACCLRIEWILQTPKSVREFAVFEARKNYKSAFTNLRNNHIKYFKMTYKSKKRDLLSWTIGIPKTAITNYRDLKQIGLYESKTTNSRIKLTEKINNIENDCTIHFDGIHYYLCVPEKRELKTTNKNQWICSIDPGMRKFQTVYSPTNDNYTIIGEQASKMLYTKLLTLDKLLSKPNKNKLKIKKLRLRIKRYQNELHNKTIAFLCDNYNEINIPKLTKNNDIIKKKSRKINTKTVRNMTILGHAMFIKKLKAKAELYTNVKVNIVTEEYTSQRCFRCDKLTKTTNEIYKCSSCGYKVDRDVLGSTNILLKEIKKMRDTANVDIHCLLDMDEWRKLVANSLYLGQEKITYGNSW